jgi:Ser/Thr protein kinase RdoA (MazF antagonist)
LKKQKVNLTYEMLIIEGEALVTIDEILDSFMIIPSKIVVLPGRMFMCNYKVTSNEGIEYFIKCYPKNKSINSIKLLHIINEQLLFQGIPVPRMHKNRHNEVFIKINDLLYGCYEYISYDESFKNEASSTYQAGNLLAKIHRILKDIQVNEDNESQSIRYLSSIETGIKLLLCGARNDSRSVSNEIVSCSSLIEESMEDISTLIYEMPNIQLIHGDFGTSNVLIKNNEIVACIDFDNCYLGSIEEDIAEAALMYFGTKNNTKNQLVPDNRLCKEFLKGYIKETSITTSNIDRLPRVLRARCLRYLSNYGNLYSRYIRLPETQRIISSLLFNIKTCSNFDHPWKDLSLDLKLEGYK